MLEASQKKMDRDVTVTLYLIRHGESRHNSASRNLDFGPFCTVCFLCNSSVDGLQYAFNAAAGTSKIARDAKM